MTERETEPDDLASAIGGFINQQKARIAELEHKLAEAREENLEQARLLGMSAEREADLRGELEREKRRADGLRYELAATREQRDRLAQVIEAATVLIAAKGRHNTFLAYEGLRAAVKDCPSVQAMASPPLTPNNTDHE